MKDEIEFLIRASKLKEIPRRGWVLRGVKTPETISDHLFRVAIAGWIFGAMAGYNIQKMIEITFFHDLCEVYAGDVTPFFYFIRDLPKDKKKKEEFLKKSVRLSQEEKIKRGREKFNLEKKSLLKLLSFLDLRDKNEIFSHWLDYEKMVSKEGSFSRQLDKVETLLQAIEYFGTKKNSFSNSWWEEIEETVDHPLLLDFLVVIRKKFYQKTNLNKKEKRLGRVLDFLLEIGKLKRMPRLYWVLRGIKKPETVAGHIFTLTLMAWIFGRKRPEFNLEKLLKMSLSHELSAVYTGDTTPYDRILPKKEKERKKILEKMIRLSKEKKEWIFLADLKREKTAMKKLTRGLFRGEEIFFLWEEYRKKTSKEARFLAQLNTLSVLLQGLIFEKSNKNFSTSPLWEWAFESCEDPIAIELMESLKKKFYKSAKINE